MKLPFDLGVKLFFRLLLPGFFITLGLWPCMLAVLHQLRLDGQQEVVFVLAIIVFGWLIVAADMPVYMLLEGRRFWPTFLWHRLFESERQRLSEIDRRIDRFHAAEAAAHADVRRDYLEASVELRAYPIGADGLRYAAFPTRLGNTIAAFEEYPRSRYGLDAIFYWPRIWVNIGKDLREELDNQQAMADSTVYSSFVLAAAATVWFCYAILTAVQPPLVGLLASSGLLRHPLDAGIFRYLPSPALSLLLSGLGFIASSLAYRLAVFANEQFGSVFMAVIDANVKKVASEYVDVDGVAARVTALTNIEPAEGAKLEIARRYLQYYNVKLPSRARAVPFPQLRREVAGADVAERHLSAIHATQRPPSVSTHVPRT